MNLEERLIKHIEILKKDIVRLRSEDKNQMRNLINLSDAKLLEDEVNDLLEVLEG